MNSRDPTVNDAAESLVLRMSRADLRVARAAAAEKGFDSVESYAQYLLGVEERAEIAVDSKIEQFPRAVVKGDFGAAYCADSAAFMRRHIRDRSVDLIMTSPPFGLVRKKDYGNEDSDSYLGWFRQFAEQFVRVLKPSGSLVIDIGSAWKKGTPTKSLYQYELLIMLCRRYGFHLSQEFFWWNPARLPTPAEWVNIRRVRVKDAVNCIWWLSLSPFPKASNRRVLQPYSKSMLKLLRDGYVAKRRPSGHDISTKFQRDNGGAIPPNLIALANTESNTAYQRYCREHKLPEHPARFPAGLPAFFLALLTNPGDVVVDPFAGSCVTGAVAESMRRQWTCIELSQPYLEGAKARFGSAAPGPGDVGVNRSKPYEIYAPVVVNQDVKLQRDGGRSRPSVSKR